MYETIYIIYEYENRWRHVIILFNVYGQKESDDALTPIKYFISSSQLFLLPFYLLNNIVLYFN